MKDFRETIDGIFGEIEIRLTLKLSMDGFQVHSQVSTPEDFGSRFTKWRKEVDKLAIRLIWDGKERWFSVEEFPFVTLLIPGLTLC